MRAVLRDAGSVALALLLQEAKAQGHFSTGRLAKEAQIRTYGTPGKDALVGVQILLPAYALALERGVSAKRVPFGRRGLGTRGGTSEYISGLERHFARRYPAYGPGRHLKLAFATARVAAKTGHPTPGSFSFTENGRRLGFIEAAVAGAGLARVERALDLGTFVQGEVRDRLTSLRLLLGTSARRRLLQRAADA